MTSKTKKVQIEHEVLEDIICDMCGKSCTIIVWDEEHKCIESAHFWASWGYGGYDGAEWKADLCIQCADAVKDFIESKGGKVLITEH